MRVFGPESSCGGTDIRPGHAHRPQTGAPRRAAGTGCELPDPGGVPHPAGRVCPQSRFNYSSPEYGRGNRKQISPQPDPRLYEKTNIGEFIRAKCYLRGILDISRASLSRGRDQG
jgi:hypothetical protein